MTAAKGVVILAATNRPESLDPALLRPGRFDRRIPVELPDLQGRDRDFEGARQRTCICPATSTSTSIARATSGASGADLANIINEARSACRDVSDATVSYRRIWMRAVETVIAGYQRKNAVISAKEKQIVAYHEIGHALVAAQAEATPPRCTRSPSFRAPPAHWATPCRWMRSEQNLMSREELLDKIATLTGGRAAEELIFGIDYHRRVQRHRAGHQADTLDDHALRHEPQVRYGCA